jgi:hypothetical protein
LRTIGSEASASPDAKKRWRYIALLFFMALRYLSCRHRSVRFCGVFFVCWVSLNGSLDLKFSSGT